MRIVLDTNVLIAAFIARGVCHDVLEYCARRHTLVTSDFVLDEFTRKLVGKFKSTSEVTDEAAALLRSRMEVVTPTRLDTPVCRDEDDDNILAIAVTGTAISSSRATKTCSCSNSSARCKLLVLETFRPTNQRRSYKQIS